MYDESIVHKDEKGTTSFGLVYLLYSRRKLFTI